VAAWELFAWESNNLHEMYGSPDNMIWSILDIGPVDAELALIAAPNSPEPEWRSLPFKAVN
jgi:hypothetical protein